MTAIDRLLAIRFRWFVWLLGCRSTARHLRIRNVSIASEFASCEEQMDHLSSTDEHLLH